MWPYNIYIAKMKTIHKPCHIDELNSNVTIYGVGGPVQEIQWLALIQ